MPGSMCGEKILSWSSAVLRASRKAGMQRQKIRQLLGTLGSHPWQRLSVSCSSHLLSGDSSLLSRAHKTPISSMAPATEYLHSCQVQDPGHAASPGTLETMNNSNHYQMYTHTLTHTQQGQWEKTGQSTLPGFHRPYSRTFSKQAKVLQHGPISHSAASGATPQRQI